LIFIKVNATQLVILWVTLDRALSLHRGKPMK